MLYRLVVFSRKQCAENEMDAHFKFDPICELQELWVSRNWILPKHEIFGKSTNGTSYSVKCTVKGKRFNFNF